MSANEHGMSAQQQRTILPTAAKWSPEQSRLWMHMSETHNMDLTSTEEFDIRHAANAGAEERIRILERELTAERERVRVLREALEDAQQDLSGKVFVKARAALAATDDTHNQGPR
jgi:hypothetical protein